MHNPGVELGVQLALDQLSTEELATFGNLIGWEDANLRKVCEGKEWFSKVETLFTANEGNNVHAATRTAIYQMIQERLTKELTEK